MATYTIDKRPKRLREGDKVIFSVDGEPDLEYEVDDFFLGVKKGQNRAIFTALGLNKHDYASSAYGYKARLGDWPESKDRDFAALCRLVNALYDEIEKKAQAPETKATQAAASPTSLGWVFTFDVPSQENGIEECEFFPTPKEALEAAKDHDRSPVYVFELFAGPVKRYTNQLVEETL